MLDYIPEEIVVGILKSLPVKSLLRFRCVCKQWKQIMESPSFVQQHLQNQNPNPRFLFNNKPQNTIWSVDPFTAQSSIDSLSNPLEVRDAEYAIFGTLHGVVCLYSYHGYFVLWNPSICKASLLPLPQLFIDWNNDLAEGRCSSAFWIDPCTKDFKIVFELNPIPMEDPAEGALYSSAEQLWSHNSEGTKGSHCRVFRHRLPAVMVDGVAYWIATSGCDDFLKSYDFVQERYGFDELKPLPYEPDLGLYAISICNWRGNLSLVFHDWGDHICEIFLREQGLWVKMLSFNLLPEISQVFWVWGGVEDEEEEFSVTVVSNWCFAVYDTKEGCLPLGQRFADNDIVYGYVESLVFPRA